MESKSESEPSSYPDRLTVARALLKPEKRLDPAWPALAAATFCAVCALGLAVGAILAPSASLSHMEERR